MDRWRLIIMNFIKIINILHMVWKTRPYDSTLYESLSYDDSLNFDHYDLVDNYAKTRPNVDINVVESRLQEQYVLAKQAKELEEMKKEKC